MCAHPAVPDKASAACGRAPVTCLTRLVGGHREEERVGGGAAVDVDGETAAQLFDARYPASGARRGDALGETREAIAQVAVDEAAVRAAEREQPQVAHEYLQG